MEVEKEGPRTMKNTCLLLPLLLAGLARADAPAIVSQPADTLAGVGEDATLAAGVSGSAPFACQWYALGGSPVAGAVTDMLVLTAVSPAEAGSYYLVASTDFGCVTSRVARLVVCDKVWIGGGSFFEALPGLWGDFGVV